MGSHTKPVHLAVLPHSVGEQTESAVIGPTSNSQCLYRAVGLIPSLHWHAATVPQDTAVTQLSAFVTYSRLAQLSHLLNLLLFTQFDLLSSVNPSSTPPSRKEASDLSSDWQT